ncbi:MAG: flagellar hook-associated protein FlgK [Phycisphaerales bacterium]|nr:flagellar hook-associated protein FlgK [Planctomycetota bacterium]MCH8509022.1 flagellar hook-associated protein FlgK [Phycisphaerales bacterium]
MSLNSTLQIANSSLIASQIGLQIASNNLANAATPGYTRQIAMLEALRGRTTDPHMIGAGVAVAQVRRQIDQALQERLWNGVSEQHASAEKLNVFYQLEAIIGEGTQYSTSSQLSSFFNAWSEATTLLDTQSTLINQGKTLTGFIRNMRSELMSQRRQVEDQIDAQTNRANALLQEIADINRTVSEREVGQAQASALRDRRDQIVTELAQLMDITVNENPEGLYDVFIGSTPIVLGTRNRGVEIDRETVDGVTSVQPRLKDNGAPLRVKGGSIGGLLASRAGAIDATIEKLDNLASQLIFEINKLHSTGTNANGLTSSKGTLAIASADRNLPISDPNNATFARLPFKAKTGGFYVEVRNEATGSSDRVWIEVDLDGIDANGQPGTGDDTTPEDIRAAIDAIQGLTATFTPDGRLDIQGSPGFTFSFDEDSSGVLAVMGVNSFFTGSTAQDINVRDGVEVMLGRIVDGKFVENANALRIGALAEQAISGLGGQTIGKFWSLHAQDVATQTSSARVNAEASMIVRESLEAQRASVSGVSIDEESMNLLTYQRQYQAAAQVVQITQSMFDTLLSLV